MLISLQTLLFLANCGDREAEQALTAYFSLMDLIDGSNTIRVWMVAGSFQVGIIEL